MVSQVSELEALLDVWRNCTNDPNNKDFLALGDMNLCALKWDNQNYEYKDLANKLKDFMNEEDCFQAVSDYTRIRLVGDSIQRSCIDHVIANCATKVSNPVLLGVGKSDPLGVSVTKSSKEVRTFARTTRKRIYKQFDKKAFVSDLTDAKRRGKFLGVLAASDPDEAFDVFEKEFNEVLNKHAPLKVIQNRSNYVPYITPSIRKNMEERNKLKEKASTTGDISDYEEYKKKRNYVSKLLKTAQEDYVIKRVSDDNCSKSMWRTAFDLLGNHKASFPSQILHRGELLSKPKVIAAAVNEFFVGKINELKEQFPRQHIETDDQALDILKKYIAKKEVPVEGFELKELDDEAMKKLLKSLKGKKSSGMDWICGYSLKIGASLLSEELKTIINLCFRSGKFVNKWKCAKILPAWKNKGTRFELKFYRPLANLSEISKLVEKAVHDQLYDYLKCNDLIHQNHHGFLKSSSTSTALQHILDVCLQHLDKGKFVSSLFLDLSAGFDVISHPLLLLKMKEYNLSQNTIDLFSSYLTERSQCVQVESALSPPLLVQWGVPQGSILGPLLFLLFLNELPETVKEPSESHDDPPNEINDAEIIVYADDNSPLTADTDPFVLQKKAQNEADIVTRWFNANDMICSSDKTKLLVVGTQANRLQKLTQNNRSLSINVCGDVKDESVSERLLGVIVNNTATFKNHILGDADNPGLVKQLATRVGMLKKLRKFLPPAKLMMVMDGIFGSKLAYGITVWGRVWQTPGTQEEEIRSSSITKEDIRKIQVLQNKCLRIVTNSDYKTPTAALLQKTNRLSVHQQIAYLCLSEVFSIYQSKAPSYHYKRLFVRPHNTNPDTRSNTDYYVNRIEFKLSLCRANFFNHSSRLWAALPNDIKASKNKEVFKKKCRSWVKSKILIKP